MSLYTCKPEIISLLFSPEIKVVKMSGFFKCAETKHLSDKNEQSYVVTYYKITQLCRGPFCLCFIM